MVKEKWEEEGRKEKKIKEVEEDLRRNKKGGEGKMKERETIGRRWKELGVKAWS